MADDELRQAERAWTANPHDQDALAAWIGARYRAGLPVTHDLLARRVHAPRRFDLPFPAWVRVERPDGEWDELGRTPAAEGGLEVPAHRALWVRPEDGAAVSAALLAGRDVHGVDLCEVDGVHGRSCLSGLAGVTLTGVEVRSRQEDVGDVVALLAGLPCLASLDLDVRYATVSGETLAPLSRARHLSRVHLDAKALTAGALGALGGVAELRDLEVYESRQEPRRLRPLSLAEITDLARARSLAALRLMGAEVVLDDDALTALAERLPDLRCLSLHSEVVTDAGVGALGPLSLEELSLVGSQLGDGAVQLLALQPLRRLFLNARLTPAGARLLPRTLEELSLRVPTGDRCLEWLSGMACLRELALDLTRETKDGDLVPVSSLALEELRLNWPHRGAATSRALLHLRSMPTLRRLELHDLPDVQHLADVLPTLPLERLLFAHRADLPADLVPLLPSTLARLDVEWCDGVSRASLQALAAARPGLLVLHNWEPVTP